MTSSRRQPRERSLINPEEQNQGRMVAMAGDGTTMLPLWPRDVGLAMNTGTQQPRKPATMWTSTATRPSSSSRENRKAAADQPGV